MSRKGAKYRKYQHADMLKALASIRDGTLSIRKASGIYDIPKSTIIDRLHNRIEDDVTSSGQPSILSSEEEKKLALFIIDCAKIGYPLKKINVMEYVKKICDADGRKNPFKDNLPGKFKE